MTKIRMEYLFRGQEQPDVVFEKVGDPFRHFQRELALASVYNVKSITMLVGDKRFHAEA
jgi:hypothetical protein